MRIVSLSVSLAYLAREDIPTGKFQAVLSLFEYLADIGCPSTIVSFAISRAGHLPGSREFLEIGVSSLGNQSSQCPISSAQSISIIA
jgi:hypothetical protein